MAKRRGRPASKNPRTHRIETRINDSTTKELRFVCKAARLSITAVIEKAIHLMCLLTSDSRTKDDAMYAIESTTGKNETLQAQWNQLIEVLSDINYSFPNIDEAKLTFICDDMGYNSNEEVIKALVDYEYEKIASRYSPDEMRIWNKEIHGEFPEPNDDGILEDFEMNF
jgi:hypothetical protein